MFYNIELHPGERVLKKAVWLSFGLSLWLIWMRHVENNLSSLGSVAATATNVLIAVCVVGLIGGALAGSIYDSFLKAVEANNDKSSFVVFGVECLFALTAPLLGAIGLFFLSGAEYWAEW